MKSLTGLPRTFPLEHVDLVLALYFRYADFAF